MYLILVRDVITNIRHGMCDAAMCVCVFCVCVTMLSKNMCYRMAKFANEHDDRAALQKLFRLLIDSGHSACRFQALTLPHILFTYFTLFLLSLLL